MKVIRENGARSCLEDIWKYVTAVAYSDTQRFSCLITVSTKTARYKKETPNTVLVWGGISSCHPNASLCRVTGKFQVQRSKSVMKCVADLNGKISILEWPKSFGDLMPLDTIWLKMSNEFTKAGVTTNTEEGLWKEVSFMWQKVCHVEYVHKLILQIPLKLKKVIDCHGSKYVD
uniref:Uncharacterized protein n=1 Tax=Daphnia galeata TaxID=27404 RepID=A0A8J2RJW7_9CRUS|nr:unnamed protein product [Daphnia galeata]